jgi:hypothetical protein
VIKDEGAARKALAEINKESLELLERAATVQGKINDLQRFFRNQAQGYKDYNNGRNLRTAGSELSYVGRSFPKFMGYLKRLADYAYPLIADEDHDDDDEQSSPNKIDKNVKVSKPTIVAKDVETLEESDG